MPEVPELEHVRHQLERRLAGREVARARLRARGGAILLRDLTQEGLQGTVEGQTIADVRRRGKFLIFDLAPGGRHLVINPKLAGKIRLREIGTPRRKGELFFLEFKHPTEELRYHDRKSMGQLYLTDELDDIPTFAAMGPEALGVPRRTFFDRLQGFRGEIKGVLTRERFLAGIGNAYADEILWQAQLNPYRKRPSLDEEEVERLYAATRQILLEAGHLVREAMGAATDEKPRDFHQIHLRGGSPCPRCGTSISEVRARRRITNFCRSCQPGGLISGM